MLKQIFFYLALSFVSVQFIACGNNYSPNSTTNYNEMYYSRPSYDSMEERRINSSVSNIGSVSELSGQAEAEFNTNSFDHINENVFIQSSTSPLSTFSADVDSASYTLVKSFIENSRLPSAGMIRTEEMLNFFEYSYPAPQNEAVAIDAQLSDTFWNKEHKLLRIGIKAKEFDWDKRPSSHFIFLIDVSGSMDGENRLPLVKKSLTMLLQKLNRKDKISIVTYASGTKVVLEASSDKAKIRQAIASLYASGSTNGGDGLEKAYELAQKHFIKGGINRIILASDGDFNVGMTSQDELLKFIQQKAKSGVYFSVFGFGMGNFKDSLLVKLADNGNGNYGYIDDELEAKRLLVDRIGASLITIAKDVKIQVEFNPSKVAAYRLIGYEKRKLNNEDFNDDEKDAAEMGLGHSVTALYELIPADSLQNENKASNAKPIIDPLKYSSQVANEKFKEEWLNIKIRYKEPLNQAHNKEKSKLIEKALSDKDYDPKGDVNTRFAAAVAAFAMILQDSKYKGSANFDMILEILNDKEVSNDVYKKEFIGLVSKASRLKSLNNKSQ
ncbi:hypothetical protein CQA38_00760 [Campylobacter sp. MIT 12-5580]|uniref:vWA domain-containing protein n=1 Tax=Campylobacter sp. MIT 12-5580 TaxID=2040651 RepID=UPI0010F91387|nr:VWA domain-containing protein [Campylobacter sp. MIT 12-5580]TKX30203.1 hypothetical protein CQA38_00760 [Campylobacter sp. MIT 12-5580]